MKKDKLIVGEENLENAVKNCKDDIINAIGIAFADNVLDYSADLENCLYSYSSLIQSALYNTGMFDVLLTELNRIAHKVHRCRSLTKKEYRTATTIMLIYLLSLEVANA